MELFLLKTIEQSRFTPFDTKTETNYSRYIYDYYHCSRRRIVAWY